MAAGREYYAEEALARRTAKERRVVPMNTYELLMVIIGFMNCLLIVLVAFIGNMKK